MRHSILWILLAALVAIAPPAFARDPIALFPSALIDAACTDDYDVPAASDRYTPQTSGSPDGLCDGDTNVLTGAFVADKDIGPLGSEQYQSAYVMIDADTVTGGDTKWRLCIAILTPWTAATYYKKLDCTADITGTVDRSYVALGPVFTDVTFDIVSGISQPLPPRFVLTLDLVGATSWEGSLGFVPIYGGGAK